MNGYLQITIFIAAFAMNTLLINQLRSRDLSVLCISVWWFGLVTILFLGLVVAESITQSRPVLSLLLPETINTQIIAMLLLACLCGLIGNYYYVNAQSYVFPATVAAARGLEPFLIGVLYQLSSWLRLLPNKPLNWPYFLFGSFLVFVGFVFLVRASSPTPP